MLGFLTRRLAAAVVILLTLSLVIFVLQYVSPGDPARAYVGANASNEMVAAERQRLGLNDPFFTQYFRFLGGLFTGDLGRSLRTRQPVTSDLAAYLPATVELVVAAFFVALALAALYAMSGALRWPGARIGRGVLLLMATAPPFLLALVGIIVFFGQLGWLPARGVGNFEDPGPTGMQAVDTLLHGQANAFLDALQHLVLPAVVLSIAPAIAIGRVLRSSLLDVLGEDYIRTARAKGLSEWDVVVRHGLSNGLLPVVTLIGFEFSALFGGLIITEAVFSVPGLGQYVVASILNRDYPAAQGIVLVLAGIVVLGNLTVDLIYGWLDPRTRMRGAQA